MAVLALFGQELVQKKNSGQIFFTSILKKNVASSKSYRGSKAISEGMGVILNRRGGVIIFFLRQGRTPWPPLLTYALRTLKVQNYTRHSCISKSLPSHENHVSYLATCGCHQQCQSSPNKGPMVWTWNIVQHTQQKRATQTTSSLEKLCHSKGLIQIFQAK